MSIIVKPNTFVAATEANASEVNANFDTIYDDYNGGITAANLATDAVTTAKIAADAVTAAKIADGAIDATAKIADEVVTSEKLKASVAFHAYRNAAQSIGASVTVVVFDTERYDYGSDFNTTTGLFTAPVAGVYHFDAGVVNSAAAQTRAYLDFNCSTAGAFSVFDVTGTDINKSGGSLTVDLAAGETVGVRVLQSNSGDVAGTQTFFSGYLVGQN